MMEFLKAIVYGVIGSFVYALFSDYVDYLLTYRKSEFTGYWKNYVLGTNSEVVKVDYCHLLHNRRKNTIQGTIVREYPKEQDYRRWYCNGCIVKDKIIMAFWSADDTQKSDGSGYLFLTEDKKFEGIYVHGTKDNKTETVNVKSEKIKNVDEINRAKKLLRK